MTPNGQIWRYNEKEGAYEILLSGGHTRPLWKSKSTMVVKFALLPKQWDGPRRKKKVLAVGPLVGSKTYEDRIPVPRDTLRFPLMDDETDTLSALELALNNTDTQVVGAADPRPSRNLLRCLLPKAPPPTKTPDEARDEIPAKTLSRAASDAKSNAAADSYIVTLTPQTLTGLIPSLIDGKNQKKIKAYMRVVRKASGIQMLPDTPRLLKTPRLLGASSATWSPDQSLHMQSTSHYRHVLHLEVGIIHPVDGLVPLGTATVSPRRSTADPATTRVPIERIAAPRGFLRRGKKPDAASYRLSRSAVLTCLCSVVTEETLLGPEIIPRVPSIAATRTLEALPEEEEEDQKIKETERLPTTPPPGGGILSVVSSPLSCCSADEFLHVEEPVAEEKAVSPRDIVFEHPVLMADSTIVAPVKEEEEKDYWCCGLFLCCGSGGGEAASKSDNVTVIEEIDDRMIPSVEETTLPPKEEEPVIQQPMLDEHRAAIQKPMQDEPRAVIQKPMLDDPRFGGNEEEEFETNRSCLACATCAGKADTTPPPEETKPVELPPPPGSPNCIMSCLGDEDVENLKYAYMEADDPRIPPPPSPSLASGDLHEDITVPASGGTKETPNNARAQSQSRLERVLDTKSSSVEDEMEEEEEYTTENYSTSYSGTLFHEENEASGCFPFLAALSSEGDMSYSTISQHDSLAGMTLAEPRPSSPTIRILPDI